MKRILNIAVWIGVFVLLDFMPWADMSLWSVILIDLCALYAVVIWVAFFTKKTESVVVAHKAMFVKRRTQYTVIKTEDGRTFVNRNDWIIKRNSKELDKIIKVGNKYQITSYYEVMFLDGDRNILFAHEVKSSNRKKVVKKSK